MRLGISNAILHAPFHLVQECLAQKGIELDFDVSSSLRKEYLRSGEHKIINISINSLLSEFSKLPEYAKIIGVLYIIKEGASVGSDAIVSQRRIKTAAELFSHRIGVVKKSLSHFLFEYYFFKKGLPPKTDYIWCQSRVDYVDKLTNEEIDAAIFCQPFLGKVMADARFHRFPDDQECFWPTVIAVLVARDEVINKPILEALLKCYLKGRKAFNNNSDEEIINSLPDEIRLNHGVEVIKEIRENIHYEDESGIAHWLGEKNKPGQLHKVVEDLINFANNTGYCLDEMSGEEIEVLPADIIDQGFLEII